MKFVAHKLFILGLIVVSCTGPDASVQDVVKEVVENYYEGIRQHDKESMISATTSDFILYEDGKVWNNDSVFREMGRHRYSVNFTFTDFEVVVERDQAYASYHVDAGFVFDDSLEHNLNFIENAAFRKNDGRWQMSLLQVCDRNIRYDTIYYAPEYYRERTAAFEKEGFQKGGIVLLGNSIIEYGNWRQLFADSSVVNRGIAADNSFGVLKRLDEVIARQPAKLIVEIGINDLSQNVPLNLLINNIQMIVGKVRSGPVDTKIFVLSMLPTNDDVENEYPDAFNKNRLAEVANERLKLLSADGSFVYLNLDSKLRDADGKLDRKFAQTDGLHLNDEGYKVFVEMLKKL